MDRQVKAERAWLIPYLFSEKIGGFEFARLRSLGQVDVRELMSKPLPLHRFPERMSENFYDAIQLIAEAYASDASKIWRGQPSSAEVVFRFLQFRGIGPKIATMATNILAREFKIPLSDYYSVDFRRCPCTACVFPPRFDSRGCVYRSTDIRCQKSLPGIPWTAGSSRLGYRT
jgi:endonuclease III